MSLRIGITASPAELPAALAAFPGIATCRVFGPPGSGIPSWTRNQAMIALRKAHITAWVSFKDWPSDTGAVSAVSAWLDTLPADVPEVWLSYHHEPEGDLASYEYRRRWVILAAAVRGHRHGARVRLVPIHTLYPSRRKVGDRYSTDWTKWVGAWQQWVPLDGKGRFVGDAMGWDCYQTVDSTGYEDPEDFFRIPVGAAYITGVPLAIPELGALRTASDTSGQGRAEWIRACLAHLIRHQAVAVNWWHGTGSAGHDYRLSDRPSTAAWREAVTAARHSQAGVRREPGEPGEPGQPPE